MSNKISITIMIILGVVVIGLVIYNFVDKNNGGNFRGENPGGPLGNEENFSRGNFSLTDEIKNSTMEFFSSSPSLEDERAYCEKNMPGCFYYCKEINPPEEICTEISARLPGGRQ